MRPLIAALLLALALPALAQDWTPVSTGTSATLLSLENGSSSDLYVVGAGGFALLSDLGRENWSPFSVGTTADLYSVVRTSAAEIWFGAGDGRVRHYINSQWESPNLPAGQDYSLFSRGSGTCGAVGSLGDIYSTVDNGDTWDYLGNAGVPLHAGRGFVTSQFWVVGDQGTILKTTNGGASFDVLNSGTTADLHAFLEGIGYFAVGENGTILKSTDAGATWVPKYSGSAQTLRAISRSGQDAGRLLVVGDAGTVLRSIDNGETWCHLDSGTTEDLYSVNMVLNSEYIVTGANGTLTRTTTGGGDCISTAAELPLEPTSSLALYPNPLRGSGSVRFAAPRAGDYALAVFDVAGRRLATLERGRLAAGETRDLTLDTRGWSAGVYFLRLDQGDTQVARRFTVLR